MPKLGKKLDNTSNFLQTFSSSDKCSDCGGCHEVVYYSVYNGMASWDV